MDAAYKLKESEVLQLKASMKELSKTAMQKDAIISSQLDKIDEQTSCGVDATINPSLGDQDMESSILRAKIFELQNHIATLEASKKNQEKLAILSMEECKENYAKSLGEFKSQLKLDTEHINYLSAKLG